MSETQTITCTRCKQTNPALAKPPFLNPLGERIQAEICDNCWQSWLMQQTRIMNHFGLNTMDPEHRKILLENLKGYLFNEGPMAQIDTSLEGTISH